MRKLALSDEILLKVDKAARYTKGLFKPYFLITFQATF